jgi:uncharacterized protein (DUF4415 family)
MKKKSTSDTSKRKYVADRTDHQRLKRLTDKEVARATQNDPDNFLPDAQWFANAKLVTPRTKNVVTLRLDPEILEWFRGNGRGYQTRINTVLKAFVAAQQPRP